MNKFSLKFLDKELEQKYQAEAQHEKIQRFNSLVQMELLLSLLSSIYYAVRSSNAMGMVTLALVIMVAIGLILVKKLWPKILIYYLVTIFFAFTVLFTESINMSRTTNGFSEEAIALNVPLQLYTYAVLLTKTSWIFCAFYYSSSCVYLFIRVFNLTEWGGGHKDLIVIGFAFSIIGFGYMSYKLEKTVRGFYKSINDSDKSLTHFKLLVQNIMPDPIFIIDYNESKIKFFNKSAFQILNEKQNCSSEPINSTNFLKKTGKSTDFFLGFEKFINTRP